MRQVLTPFFIAPMPIQQRVPQLKQKLVVNGINVFHWLQLETFAKHPQKKLKHITFQLFEIFLII